MTASLKGRSALITGASMGLGLAIARAYVAAGANVMISSRGEGPLRDALGSLAALASEGQIVAAESGDVANPADAERLVAASLQRLGQLEVLVNNAGVYGPKGTIDEVDWDAWAEAIRVNLLGSVLMARAILPYFKAQRYGKIVQLSGGGATAPLPRISAYAASKAGIVRFAETLAEEVRGFGIDVNSIAPGALNTRLLDEVLEAGPDKVGEEFYERAVRQASDGGTPLERGAGLAVFLASPLSDGITGKLISAVWDPWETLGAHVADLQSTDVYTLRRIVPKDRGLVW
ncbi:MAG: SDR family oxidoreductase [Candidatus Limnocylindrales bacterium]|jgi:3-oxoacyl-[acyl-carrier protein] reductase